MNKFKIFDLVRPYKYMFTVATICFLIFSDLGLAVPWMIKIIIDKVMPTADYELLISLCLVMLLIYGVRCILRYLQNYMFGYIATRILIDIRLKLFKHLQNLSLRFYEEYRTGKLISNVISDVALLQSLTGVFINLADKIVLIVLTVTIMLWISPIMTLAVSLLLPLHYFNYHYYQQVQRKDYMLLQEKMSEISANLAETLSGVKVVKSFAKERAECRQFFSSLIPTLDLTMRIRMQSTVSTIITDMLSLICILAAAVSGTVMISHGKITVGEFVAFYTYVGMLLGPINMLSTVSTEIAQGMAGASRVNRLLNTIPDIKEDPNPLRIDTLRGEVEFKNVTFSYDEGKKVIKNFSVKINPGQKIALVGPSGSGKSTISNLLMRFYDVDSGEIAVDGYDIRKLALDSYRNKTGMVLQNPFLFSGSIRQNIAYSKENATQEEIERAAAMANVDEFTCSLEKGYDTEVGENGTMLSGGQKQRIAIARAILRNPSILILDEATSALDTVSEYLVQDALDNLMRGRTTIIIAHRLSTIRNADMIVVLKEGAIVQKGSHQELMNQSGLYRELYQVQEKVDKSREAAI